MAAVTFRFIRSFALWSLVWFGATLLQQVFFVWHGLQPEFVNDPKIGRFAFSYVWSSSIIVVTRVLIGLTLSLIVLRTQSRWSCALLVLFLVFNLWSTYLQGIESFFRPPVGDGSWQRAMHLYIRLHGNGWNLLRGTGLLALIACGTLAAVRPRDVQSAADKMR